MSDSISAMTDSANAVFSIPLMPSIALLNALTSSAVGSPASLPLMSAASLESLLSEASSEANLLSMLSTLAVSSSSVAAAFAACQ
ncbi:MAG: hypothetical protein QXW23_03675 [Thermofilaceae archaeon]